MEFSTPESMGISSRNILRYIKKLESNCFSTHDMIIMRGGKIIYEAYWKPFHKDFGHRMYSVTKSFVSLAIGFLEQEGKISLDDPIAKYFPDEIKNQNDEYMNKQTIRHMLMMSTAKYPQSWFVPECTDRVCHYFENPTVASRHPGTFFMYDSNGSFILGALVERITGMELIEYLRERLFDKIGVSKEAYMLKCPGGHSWGDSGLICTARDLLLTAQFVMNQGKWNGEQILNEEYVTTATSKLIDSNRENDNECASKGYGYQFWRTFDNSFFFNGMGCQFAICVPDKDIIFIYNGDNQGMQYAKKTIIENFFDLIVRPAVDGAFSEEQESQAELEDYSSKLVLSSVKGETESCWVDKINNKVFIMGENAMGISKMKLSFDADGGTLYYTNAQGNKELRFGMCTNRFGDFPQDGYSDEIGMQPGNRRYRCAASAAWVMPNTLSMKVQIIDTYFGLLHIKFAFVGDEMGVVMSKAAEAFLEEYVGFAGGKMQ